MNASLAVMLFLLTAAGVAAVLLLRASASKAAANREFQHNLEYLLWIESRLHQADRRGDDPVMRECLAREMSRVSRILAAQQIDGWRAAGRRASQHP